MSDVAIADAPIEPVPPIPEAPAVSPEAAEQVAAAPAEKVDQAVPEADAAGDAPTVPTERVLPEIEYAIGGTRQAILDHFTDIEGDQSMAQIKAALPTVLFCIE